MLAEKALDLIKELQRSKGKSLPPYNEELIRQVHEEMKLLFEQNQTDVRSAVEGNQELYPSIQMRHAALERNKRCLLAYLYNRLMVIRKMRWDIGSVLPDNIKANLSPNELRWFEEYNRSLVTYIRKVGGIQFGLDLTQDVKPPKSVYIEVRCLVDHGEFETQDGTSIILSKNSQHFLMRSECEHLIRNGTLEHIIQ